MANQHSTGKMDELEVDLDRDGFFRSILRELAGTLSEVVGLEEASGFVALVGQRLGEQINTSYRRQLQQPSLDRTQVAQVLVDLKRRIGGEFTLKENTAERLEFAASRCPFGKKVEGRPALCMMTSNVFGTIASDNLGYARVELAETIANGDRGCKVIVHLRPTQREIPHGSREYFGELPPEPVQ